MNAKICSFPKGFLWGTATSAHQVEGGNRNNDWWQWEQQDGTIAGGTTAEVACDHYNRYQQDFDLIRSFGHNTHRLSIEWSRIEPEEGVFAAKEILHYGRVLEALRERGVEPLVTLHHFANPLWLSRNGGWENPKAVDYFIRYAKMVAAEYGSLVRLWNTINEPVVYAYLGYVEGIWPPGERNLRKAATVMGNMARAHALSYQAIHEATSDSTVGIVKHIRNLDPLRAWHPLDRALAALSDSVFNWRFLKSLDRGRLIWPLGWGQRAPYLKGTMDFVGLNYYTRQMIGFDLSKPHKAFMQNQIRPGCSTNDKGWEIYPEGLYRVLMRLKRYGKPIYITENGCATADDRLRQLYLRDHLIQLHKAICDGADVRGYYHWSLLDNFEWADGLTPRYGLVEVDYATQKRIPRTSALIFSKIASNNMVDFSWFDEADPSLQRPDSPQKGI